MEGEANVLEGKFNDKPGCWGDGRLGVAGKVGSALSSLLGGRLKSPVDGCAVCVGFVASDKDRDLGERDSGSSWAPETCGCDSCWLSLLSNGCAVALRPGADGRTWAIFLISRVSIDGRR